jgi:hypothetical protein
VQQFKKKMKLFLDIAPCPLVNRHKHFEEEQDRHLQDQTVRILGAKFFN